MTDSTALIACHECDLLQRETDIPPGGTALCARCGAKLYRCAHESLDRPIAFLVTAAITLVIANVYPIVALEIQGTSNATTLFGAAQALWAQGSQPIGVLVFLTTFLVPAVELTVIGYLLISLRSGRRPVGFTCIMKLLQHVNPWGMVEVFILGVIVALVKLTHYGRVIPDMALWAFGTLTLLLAATASSFNARDIWNRVDSLPGNKEEE